MLRFLKLVLAGVLVTGLLAGCGQDSNPMESRDHSTKNSGTLALSGIPTTATIDSAQVHLHVAATDSQMVSIHRLTDSFNEADVVWDTWLGGYESSALDTISIGDTGWVSFEVGLVVADWFNDVRPNHGFLLFPGEPIEETTAFTSREAGENASFMVICYTNDGMAQCDTVEVSADTYIDETAPAVNHGDSAAILVGREVDTTTESSRYGMVRYEFETFVPPATIGDFVWEDVDLDGLQGEGEPGISGVTVNLYNCLDTLMATTTTDDDGFYVFDSLMPGDYYVEFEAPDGHVFTSADAGDDDVLDSDADEATGMTACVTVGAGEENRTLDAGLVAFGAIGDYVWEDMDMDGIQDAGEPGFEGVTVNLMACADSSMVASAVTDADGMYTFDGLMPGDYFLEVVAPEDYQLTMRDAGEDDAIDSDFDPETGWSACVSLDESGAMDMSVDAGLFLMRASVGDYVWNDMNENGLQDAGEPGLEGIMVKLYTCEDMLVDSMMTDADGMYLFEDLEPGDYYLEFVNPFGYIFTYQDMGMDDAIDSDVDRYRKTTMCITLEPGDEAMNWDAGLFAFEGCTYGKGYWKNHTGFGPQADEVTPLLLPLYLGDEDGDKTFEVANAQTAYEILQQHKYGHPRNGITKLYAHFLATKLNITNFANPADIFDVVEEVDEFLADYDWQDWDMLSRADKKMVLHWKDMLESYNEGFIGPGHCDGDGHDDDDWDDDDWDDDGDDDDEGGYRPVSIGG